MSEKSERPLAHAYTLFSWRGSWPIYRCIRCGVASTSPEAGKPCPGDNHTHSPRAGRKEG